jgi:hypothetical protein
VFRDVDDIRPGEDFIHAIETHLQQVGVVLVMIGPRWLDAGADPMPWRLPGYEIAARAPLPQAGGRLFRHAHMPSFQDRLSNRWCALFEAAQLP